MTSAASTERNNNDIITSFETVETAAGASAASPANSLWIMLTPKILKVIIVVLTTAVIVGTTVIVVVIVTHVTLAYGGTPVLNTTASPSTTTTTTTIATVSPDSPTITTTTTTSSTSPSTSTTVSSSSPTTTTTATTSSTTSSSTSSTTSSTSTSTTPSTTTPTTTSTTTSTTTTTVTTVPDCADTEFLCRSGECVPWKQLCDGLPHCKDGSDEGVDCVCGSDQWKCTSGQCISSDARCDHTVDCFDSSDEMLCPDCSGFQCDTGLCLWDGNEGRCNGIFECSDLSDEMGCPPRAGTRQCNNTVRVLQSQWCDGLDHCGDNSDETSCASACRGLRMACPDGTCIMTTWRCDGYQDCQDGSDETNCATCLSTEFMCDRYQCIDESAVCDGVWDCKTGEDELHCFSAEQEDSGVLWARYKGHDYAVCSDEWSTDYAVQICIDINQLQLLEWKEVLPSPSVTRFVAFNNNTLRAQTTNLAVRSRCASGKIINITCHNQDCGERKVAFLQSFIAGGQVASPGKWPWMVSLLHLGKPICGGTLLSNSWVVTAAHCILGTAKGDYNFTSTPYYFEVIVGSTHRLGRSRIGTPYRIRVGQILLHPNLTTPAFGGMDWDVALLKLVVPVGYTDYIQPVCLPHQGQNVAPTSLCYLAGWGLMNTRQALSPENLRDTRMQLWSDARCARNTIPGEITVNTNSTLCGGFLFGKPSGCQGDSGGPLMCLAANGRWMLTGVMNRGSSPCGIYQPNIRANRFARVSRFVDWVRQQMAET